MPRNRSRRGLMVVSAIALLALIAAAKEVATTIKVYEVKNGRQKTEQTLKISCKRDNGTIVKPATLTYTQTGKCCTITPASGTVSANGTWDVTFKYDGEGKDTIVFECGNNGKKLTVEVECFKKPKKVITGENSYLPPDSDAFYQMTETQDGLVESYLAALGQEPLPGSADEHLERLISRFSAIPPGLPPMEPGVIEKAMLELQELMGVDVLLPEMMPATELALSQYDLAATRFYQSGDCNGNGNPDYEDLAKGLSKDANGDFVPDDCNCPRVIFDADVDGDVDMDDFGTFQACFTGSLVPPDAFNILPLTCRCVDARGIEPESEPDGAIDRSDFGAFLSCATGPAADPNTVDPYCDGN